MNRSQFTLYTELRYEQHLRLEMQFMLSTDQIRWALIMNRCEHYMWGSMFIIATKLSDTVLQPVPDKPYVDYEDFFDPFIAFGEFVNWAAHLLESQPPTKTHEYRNLVKKAGSLLKDAMALYAVFSGSGSQTDHPNCGTVPANWVQKQYSCCNELGLWVLLKTLRQSELCKGFIRSVL